MAYEWINTPHFKGSKIGLTQRYSSGHTAIDFNGMGEKWRGKEVLAGYRGKVVTSAWRKDRGYYVEIEVWHGDVKRVIGMAHFSKLLVQQGAKVSENTPVGLMGDTGYSEGVHVHYYVIMNGVRVNPITLLKGLKQEKPKTQEIHKKGTFKCTVHDLRVRAKPSLKGMIEGKCYLGKTYTYTKQVISDGYIWLYLDAWDTWTAWATEDLKTKHGVIK